jgi:hypothetical protein
MRTKWAESRLWWISFPFHSKYIQHDKSAGTLLYRLGGLIFTFNSFLCRGWEVTFLLNRRAGSKNRRLHQIDESRLSLIWSQTINWNSFKVDEFVPSLQIIRGNFPFRRSTATILRVTDQSPSSFHNALFDVNFDRKRLSESFLRENRRHISHVSEGQVFVDIGPCRKPNMVNIDFTRKALRSSWFVSDWLRFSPDVCPTIQHWKSVRRLDFWKVHRHSQKRSISSLKKKQTSN